MICRFLNKKIFNHEIVDNEHQLRLIYDNGQTENVLSLYVERYGIQFHCNSNIRDRKDINENNLLFVDIIYYSELPIEGFLTKVYRNCGYVEFQNNRTLLFNCDVDAFQFWFDLIDNSMIFTDDISWILQNKICYFHRSNYTNDIFSFVFINNKKFSGVYYRIPSLNGIRRESFCWRSGTLLIITHNYMTIIDNFNDFYDRNRIQYMSTDSYRDYMPITLRVNFSDGRSTTMMSYNISDFQSVTKIKLK